MDLVLDQGNQIIKLGSKTRGFSASDNAVLAQIADSSATEPNELLDKGRRLFCWLNGQSGWLNPLPNELVINADRCSAIWRSPWELLADERGHLAERGFSVLRRSPCSALFSNSDSTKIDEYRLGVLFMAGVPEEINEPLLFEDEEAAILRAISTPTGVLGIVDSNDSASNYIDVFGEDTGDLNELIDLLDLLADFKIHVLHLSARTTKGPPLSLRMEDSEGGIQPVTAIELAEKLGRRLGLIPLIVLSAAHTGMLGDDQSMAEVLIEHGANSIVGWDGEVSDKQATAFSGWLYYHLGRRTPLKQAVALSRQQLLKSNDVGWHLPRLFIGDKEPAKLASYRGRPRPVNAAREACPSTRESKDFCSRLAFVGRRRTVRSALKTLSSTTHRGIVLIGLGKQGKLSLAVRLGDRLAAYHKTVMIQGQLDADQLYEEFKKHFGEVPNGNQINHAQTADIRLRNSLKYWLNKDIEPILLILGDFEQNLDTTQIPVRPSQQQWDVVVAILSSFVDVPATRSRLVISSRVKFDCIDNQGRKLHQSLAVISVPEMNPTETSRIRTKLLDLQMRRRAERLGCGNPGLTTALLQLAEDDPISFNDTCTQLEERRVPVGKIGDLIDNIGLTHLIDLAKNSDEDAEKLLRIVLFFDLPLPERVIDQVANAMGISNPGKTRDLLEGLGLLEKRIGDYLALNSFVTTQLSATTKVERATLAPVLLKAIKQEEFNRYPMLATQAFIVAAPNVDLDVVSRTLDIAIPLLPTLGVQERTVSLAVATCRHLLNCSQPVNLKTILIAINQALYGQHDLNDLFRYVRDLLRSNNDTTNNAYFHYVYGCKMHNEGNSSQAIFYLSKAAKLFKELEDPIAANEIWAHIAYVKGQGPAIDVRRHVKQSTMGSVLPVTDFTGVQKTSWRPELNLELNL